MDDGERCTPLWVYLMPLNWTLESSWAGNVFVTYILPRVKKEKKNNQKSDNKHESLISAVGGGSGSPTRPWSPQSPYHTSLKWQSVPVCRVILSARRLAEGRLVLQFHWPLSVCFHPSALTGLFEQLIHLLLSLRPSLWSLKLARVLQVCFSLFCLQ